MRISLMVFLIGVIASAASAWAQAPAGLVVEEKFAAGIGAPVGKIILVQGSVIIIHHKERRGYRAKNDMPLFEGDMIITQDNGYVSFQLNDGSTLTLTSNTQIKISRSVYAPDKKMRSSFMDMSAGKLRASVNKLTDFKESEFKIKTKTALVGARGSDYIVEASETYTRVTALEHTELEIVSLAALGAEPIILNDFNRIVIEAGRLPSEVEEIPEIKIQELKREFMELRESERPAAPPMMEKGIAAPSAELVKPVDGPMSLQPEPLRSERWVNNLMPGDEQHAADRQQEIVENQLRKTTEPKPALPNFPGMPEPKPELPPFPGKPD